MALRGLLSVEPWSPSNQGSLGRPNPAPDGDLLSARGRRSAAQGFQQLYDFVVEIVPVLRSPKSEPHRNADGRQSAIRRSALRSPGTSAMMSEVVEHGIEHQVRAAVATWK